ncbi:MAG: lipoprotein signal peptidase [Tannerellaceae bacterium]|jgi:signal peptidase II|nr:lipoprotein signal peptidase [Tannerellaceae bacterium]
MSPAKKGWGAVLIIILLLVLDQTLKIWIKTHMQLHESIKITSWFYIYFTENPGMAFGIEIIGKLPLTLFRIVVVIFFAYYLYKVVKDNYKFSYIACVALIFSGAIGNIVDSVFYGVLFDHSAGQVATFLPEGGGYANWLHGKVVDMFYFPLIDVILPEWIPVWGGQNFIFFRPIFNLADSTICVGVFILFICYRHTLSKSLSKEDEEEEEEKEKNAKKPA